VALPLLAANWKVYVPGVVNVTVVARAQGAEKLTEAGPLSIVQATLSGLWLGSVAWPKSDKSLAGNANVFADPASTVGPL
jgi:hypothetical protein